MPYDSLLTLIGNKDGVSGLTIYRNFWNDIKERAIALGTLDEERSTILGIKYEIEENPMNKAGLICAAFTSSEN